MTPSARRTAPVKAIYCKLGNEEPTRGWWCIRDMLLHLVSAGAAAAAAGAAVARPAAAGCEEAFS